MSDEHKNKKAKTMLPLCNFKSLEQDLEISVGNDNEYCGAFSAAYMATQSGYIDALLASPMKESTTKRISFPDITISTWNSMMKFVENPAAAFEENVVPEMLTVASLYDKYDFSNAKLLCDKVMSKYLNEVNKQSPENLDLLVEVLRVSHQANLLESFPMAKTFLREVVFNVCDDDVFTTIHPCRFTEEHVKRLVPFLVVLVEDPNDETNVLLQNGLAVSLTKEEIESPLFPKLFLNASLADFLIAQRQNEMELTGVEITGASISVANGPYDRAEESWRNQNWFQHCGDAFQMSGQGDEEYDMFIRGPTGEDTVWVIEAVSIRGRDCMTLWVAPNSGHFPFPPKHGWKAVHPLARGTLEVTPGRKVSAIFPSEHRLEF